MYMGQCPANSPYWVVFKFLNLFSVNSKELLSNGPYASIIGLSIIKLLGTELIVSRTFQCEHNLSFACPGKFDYNYIYTSNKNILYTRRLVVYKNQR